jgi:hypothetical protein
VRIREFDRDFADEVIERLALLPPDRIPRWGVMKAGQLVPHLAHSMLWCMGQREAPPFVGNWLTRTIVGPLVVCGWIPIRHNVQIPIPQGTAGDGSESLDDLDQIVKDYLDAVETGGLEPAPHPLFGDLGVDEWARLHVLHFEHHFKQFDL